MNKIQKLEEELTLLENNEYPKYLRIIILRKCFDILGDYNENDFEKQMNRYLMLEAKYK